MPVALSLTRLENQRLRMMALPRAIPNSSLVAWPLSMFKATPEKPLSICDKEPENEGYRDGFNLISQILFY